MLILAGNLFFVGKVPDYRNMNASGGVLYRWNGIILIALFVLYLAYTIYLAKKNKETENDEAKKMPMWQCLLYIILGLAAIIIGGQLVVIHAKNIALAWGMSETLVGLTIVAIGTSLPTPTIIKIILFSFWLVYPMYFLLYNMKLSKLQYKKAHSRQSSA